MAMEQRVVNIKEMEVKEIDKRKSGEAFEVLLKPGQNGDAAPSPLKCTPKKEISISEIQLKQQAAEERRKAQQDALVNNLKAEEEKILKAKQKKAEANDTFMQWAQEQLLAKMCQYQDNHMAHLQSKIQKFRELNMKPDEIREKVRHEIDEMYGNLDEKIQQKLLESEQRRENMLRQVREKQQEKENHAQQVRQKKLEDNCNINCTNGINCA
uniref:Stathmin-1-A-like n=1 Tax=Phallusia mammillata TaxID=59560 RepID=A0A6F9DUK5_9ASCI|nr:stathmin-1-A-like [Phallusia mammillata]